MLTLLPALSDFYERSEWAPVAQAMCNNERLRYWKVVKEKLTFSQGRRNIGRRHDHADAYASDVVRLKVVMKRETNASSSDFQGYRAERSLYEMRRHAAIGSF